MDDSDLDFADLCAKLLKRVRKKEGGDSGEEKREEASQSLTQNAAPEPTQSKAPAKTRRKLKHDTESGSRKQLDCGSASVSQPSCPAQEENTCHPCIYPESVVTQAAVSAEDPSVPSAQSAVGGVTGSGAGGLGLAEYPNGDINLRVKEKVVLRMQKFRWVSPQKLTRMENEQPSRTALDTVDATLLPALAQDPLLGPLGDEALALRLQEELDREAQGQEEIVDLEQGDLFFCQICQRDLSAMNPLYRTQHINRCLDKSEGSGPHPPPLPAVPECPICGKRFKSQKSRATHLKRCSAELGVAPAMLLQALQRQATETASDCAAEQPPQAGGSKRKGSADPSRPPKKRQRKKAAPLDEDTMVALALSHSMKEQERESEALLAAAPAAIVSGLQYRPDAGKKRGKKKKGCPSSPPPLLLAQDSGDAFRRLQDRVAALLLCPQPPRPPTPTYQASALLGWTGAAPLWQKSALQEGGLSLLREYYTPELSPPIHPWACSTEEQTVAPPSTEGPSQGRREPGPTQGTPRLGSQTLCDLMELAEEGMTLTQWGYAPHPDPDPESAQGEEASVVHLHLRDFVPERTQTAGATKSTVALSKLTTDLSSMVNNPQLSDVQLQIDSGEVFFAHSFMLYARCPLLVQMVHDSGFGVEEEGMPCAQRVLLGEVPPGAVQALLQYLYTGHCPLTPALVPHVQKMAVRFDLGELEKMCQHCPGGVAVEPWVEVWEQKLDEEEQEKCGEQNLLELLHSMWEGEEEEEKGGGRAEMEGGGEGPGSPLPRDGDSVEEQVDDNELLEIYQFAATQRKPELGTEAVEQSGEEEEERGNGGTETEQEEEDSGKGENMSLSRPHSNPSSSHRGPSLDVLPAGPAADHVTKEGSEQASPISGQAMAHNGEEQAGLVGKSQASLGLGTDTSLDRSYNWLFSKSCGDFISPSHRDTQQGARAELQFSRSEAPVIDLSISPPLHPYDPSFPTTGLSPLHPHSPKEQAFSQQDMKKESQGCTQISSNCPELIVLSDSGEELDEDVPRVLHTDSDTKAGACQNHVPVDSVPVDKGPVDGSPKDGGPIDCSPKDEGPIDCSPKDGGPTDCSPKDEGPIDCSPKDGGPVDCSPVVEGPEDSCIEMSWLIPGTPEPPARPMRVSSTQTDCSMRRTRLFASPRTSSSSSSFSSSLRSAANTSAISKPAQPSECPAPVFAAPPGRPSLTSSDPRGPVLKGTLPCTFPQSTTSTPLPPQASLIAPIPSGGERHLESMHSPLRACLSDSSLPSPRKRAHVSQSQRKQEWVEERIEGGAEEEQSPRQQSFHEMEDPPMAFDESWDLAGERVPCFSLRLDSSTRTSQSEQSPGETMPPPQPPYTSLLDSKIWDHWEEEEEEDGAIPPLSQRVRPVALRPIVTQPKTPVVSRRGDHGLLVPITPMPGYSDMDTPELKNRLNRFGVRPLPKRQMVLKLKEIHQYTHQLQSSESEEDSSTAPGFEQLERPVGGASSTGSQHKGVGREEDGEGLSASQGSTASCTAASEDSERSNPELCGLSGSDDSANEEVSASQALSRGAERLQEVRRFILSDPELYGRVLRYEPLVLSQLQARLKAHGIRLGAAKLLDFLDSQCITCTTAKPTNQGPARGRGRDRRRMRRRRGGGATKASD